MKKIIALILSLFLCMTYVSAVNTAYAPDTLVYNAKGETKHIDEKSLDEHLSDGWYLYPVVTIYTKNDVSSVVYVADVNTHLENSWYLDPVTEIFAPGGRTSIVYTDDVATHLANGWYLSVKDFPKKEKAVALTYDDGPSKFTNRILDCLEHYGAKATFFVVGNSVYAYPDALLRAHTLGMEIGNHTMSHPRLTSISSSQISSQLNKNATVVENVTGKRPSLVRPPYGSYNQSVINTSGMPFILWSIDTLDWKTRNAQKTVDAVLSKVSDGDIILMHDLYLPTAQATEIIVPRLIDMGFDLVTVSELAERKGITLTQKAYSRIK